jgi:hypothetical protein
MSRRQDYALLHQASACGSCGPKLLTGAYCTTIRPCEPIFVTLALRLARCNVLADTGAASGTAMLARLVAARVPVRVAYNRS